MAAPADMIAGIWTGNRGRRHADSYDRRSDRPIEPWAQKLHPGFSMINRLLHYASPYRDRLWLALCIASLVTYLLCSDSVRAFGRLILQLPAGK